MKKIVCSILTLAMIFSMSLIAYAGDTANGLAEKVDNAGGKIIDIIGSVALVVGVVMVIIAGIKYMMAPAGGKADVKSSIMPLFIGGVLVGASGWLAPMVINFGKNL